MNRYNGKLPKIDFIRAMYSDGREKRKPASDRVLVWYARNLSILAYGSICLTFSHF